MGNVFLFKFMWINHPALPTRGLYLQNSVAVWFERKDGVDFTMIQLSLENNLKNVVQVWLSKGVQKVSLFFMEQDTEEQFLLQVQQKSGSKKLRWF